MANVAGRVPGSGPANSFTTFGQHPRLFRAWLRYSAQVMPFGQLPRRGTELVILRVGWQCRSASEWHKHVPLAQPRRANARRGRRQGPRSPGTWLHAASATLLAVCDELLAGRAPSDSAWSTVQATLSDREAIELYLLIGNYQALASTIGGLGIQIEYDLAGRADPDAGRAPR